jgi:hypothetical protein
MTMATITQRPSRRKAPARWQGLPYAAFRLARRYGLNPSTALTVAHAAGFAVDEVRQ